MKTFIRAVAAAVFIGLVAAPAAFAAESPSVLLQKGIYAEETEGNLDSAIKIYEQIGADAAANRAIAAQAQYRLAVCYEKQGKKDHAVAVLKELVRQFPAETALIAQSQQRLTGLGQAPSTVVSMRKTPHTPFGHVMAVSPDGRFFAAWSGSLDISVTEISTAKSWIIVKETALEHLFGYMAFSPDSQRIAFDLGGKTIMISKSDGSESKRVYVRPEGVEGDLKVLGWSPDAGRLFVYRIFYPPSIAPSVLGEIDLQSGSWKELKTLPRGGYALSVDGRYVAVSEGMPEGTGKISLHDLETNGATTLVARDVDGLAGWSPWWGDKLLFTSDRTGTTALWSITVKEGRVVGGPDLVSAGIGQRIIQGVVSDGSIFYTEHRGSSDVYAMSANFETGEVTREPRRVSDRYPGTQNLPVWSRDGQSLMMTYYANKKGFMVVSMASGEHREYPAAGLRIWQTTWSQSGGFLLYQAFKVGPLHGIHRYDLASGKVETVADNHEIKGYNSQPELSLDENSFYFIRELWTTDPLTGKGQRASRIVRKDLRTGDEEIVYGPVSNLSKWGQIKLSPNGRLLAFVSDQVREIEGKFESVANTINVLSLEGGQPRKMAQLDADSPSYAGIAWTPDGKRIAYVRGGKIWFTPIGSDETVSLNTTKVAIASLAIHPDGQQIAFAGKMDGPIGWELWVMEGALNQQVAGNVRVP